MSAVEKVPAWELVCRVGDKKIQKGEPITILWRKGSDITQRVGIIETVELADDPEHPRLVIKVKTNQTKTA